MAASQTTRESKVLSSELESSLNSLISSKNEVDIDFRGTVKMDAIDYCDQLRSQIEFEFSCAVDHLSTLRDKLFERIGKHENEMVGTIETKTEEIEKLQSQWSSIKARIEYIERKVLASISNRTATQSDFVAHKREISLLQAEVIRAGVKRKRHIYNTEKYLVYDPYYNRTDLLENTRLLGDFDSKDAAELYKKEYKKVAHLSRYFETDQIFDENCSQKVFDMDQSSTTSILSLSNGKFLTVSLDGRLKLWDPADFKEDMNTIHSLGAKARCMVELVDCQRFACGTNKGTISIFSNDSKGERNSPFVENLTRLKGHTGPVQVLCDLTDGALASGSEDLTIRIWKDGSCQSILRDHDSIINALALLPNGHLASGSKDSTIKIWNLDNGDLIQTYKEHRGRIWALAVLNNGRLVSASEDKTLKVWDTKQGGKVVQTIQTDRDHAYQTLVTLPNGDLAFMAQGNRVRVYKQDDLNDYKDFEFENLKCGLSVGMTSLGDLICGSVDGKLHVLYSVFH